MNSYLRGILRSVSATILIATVGIHARAGVSFDILKIADVETEVPGLPGVEFDQFSGTTMAVDSGRVVFWGRADIFAANRNGVYVWEESALQTIVDTSETAPSTTLPFGVFFDLNADSRHIVFDASLGQFAQQGSGAYASTEGIERRIADSTQTLPGAAGPGPTGQPRLSGDTVMLWNLDSAGVERIYATSTNGGAITPVISETEFVPAGGFIVPGGFDGDRLAMRALRPDGTRQGVYTTDTSGDLRTLAVLGDPIPGAPSDTFIDFGGGITHPVIDDGTVVFAGRGASRFGIYSASSDGSGPISVVVDTTMALPGGATTTAITAPSLSNGNVAFIGTDTTGFGTGLYVKWEGEFYDVITKGQMLDGREVQSIVQSSFGFDGRHLAFGVRFTDNTDAIYLAKIIPAPPVAVCFVVSATLAAPGRRRTPAAPR